MKNNCNEWVEAFAKEILSSKEIDFIKNSQFSHFNIKDFDRDRLKRQHTLAIPRERTIFQPKLQKIGSFILMKDGIEQQILKTAFDVMTQSILVPSGESNSEDED